MSKKNIIILYYSRGTYPLRHSIYTHLYCWRQYSEHNVYYVNLAFGFPRNLLRLIQVDVIIFHTIFLSLRWTPHLFKKYLKKIHVLSKLNCIKIAFPQDEFIHTDILVDFFDKIGVTHIGTCAKNSEWTKIYNPLIAKGIKLFTVLTGYLDREVINKITSLPEEMRDIDIGYRAWKAEYWLGEHGMHKVWVAEKFQEACQKRAIKVDISLNPSDTFLGLEWFKFLKRCKATIGVEGGASILDHTGTIRESVNRYLQHHPEASFQEVKNNCFIDKDHNFDLACLSPRHLEACLTKTCQILVEGHFNGILRANKDYISLKRDYSNIEEVLDLLNDSNYVNKITQNAFKRVVNGSFYYDTFVKEIESKIINIKNTTSSKIPTFLQNVIINFYKLKDFLTWKYISIEAKLIFHPKVKIIIKKILSRLR